MSLRNKIMITKKEVKHIAKLARLGLKDKEIEKFQKELSSILGYIEKLKEVDISKVKTEIQPIGIDEAARKDTEKPKPKIENSKKLLELAPAVKNSYLKVKSIF